MNWKDFFYFSRGERRALSLLLLIIAILFVLLILKDFYIPAGRQQENTGDGTNSTIPGTIPVKPETGTKELPQRAGQAPPPKKKYTPAPRFTKSASTFAQKYPKGTIVELNSADTTILKKVPGIGSAFANRIIRYRTLLGGFYSADQIGEVYGIDEEKHKALAPWLTADTAKLEKLKVNHLLYKDLVRHPYLNSRQVRSIIDLRNRKGALTGWENLNLLEEFTGEDIKKLTPYISFEEQTFVR